MFVFLRIARAFAGVVAGSAVSRLFMLIVGLVESGQGIAAMHWELGVLVAVALIFGMLFLKGQRIINQLYQQKHGSDHPALAHSIWRL